MDLSFTKNYYRATKKQNFYKNFFIIFSCLTIFFGLFLFFIFNRVSMYFFITYSLIEIALLISTIIFLIYYLFPNNNEEIFNSSLQDFLNFFKEYGVSFCLEDFSYIGGNYKNNLKIFKKIQKENNDIFKEVINQETINHSNSVEELTNLLKSSLLEIYKWKKEKGLAVNKKLLYFIRKNFKNLNREHEFLTDEELLSYLNFLDYVPNEKELANLIKLIKLNNSKSFLKWLGQEQSIELLKTNFNIEQIKEFLNKGILSKLQLNFQESLAYFDLSRLTDLIQLLLSLPIETFNLPLKKLGSYTLTKNFFGSNFLQILNTNLTFKKYSYLLSSLVKSGTTFYKIQEWLKENSNLICFKDSQELDSFFEDPKKLEFLKYFIENHLCKIIEMKINPLTIVEFKDKLNYLNKWLDDGGSLNNNVDKITSKLPLKVVEYFESIWPIIKTKLNESEFLIKLSSKKINVNVIKCAIEKEIELKKLLEWFESGGTETLFNDLQLTDIKLVINLGQKLLQWTKDTKLMILMINNLELEKLNLILTVFNEQEFQGLVQYLPLIKVSKTMEELISIKCLFNKILFPKLSGNHSNDLSLIVHLNKLNEKSLQTLSELNFKELHDLNNKISLNKLSELLSKISINIILSLNRKSLNWLSNLNNYNFLENFNAEEINRFAENNVNYNDVVDIITETGESSIKIIKITIANINDFKKFSKEIKLIQNITDIEKILEKTTPEKIFKFHIQYGSTNELIKEIGTNLFVECLNKLTTNLFILILQTEINIKSFIELINGLPLSEEKLNNWIETKEDLKIFLKIANLSNFSKLIESKLSSIKKLFEFIRPEELNLFMNKFSISELENLLALLCKGYSKEFAMEKVIFTELLLKLNCYIEKYNPKLDLFMKLYNIGLESNLIEKLIIEKPEAIVLENIFKSSIKDPVNLIVEAFLLYNQVLSENWSFFLQYIELNIIFSYNLTSFINLIKFIRHHNEYIILLQDALICSVNLDDFLLVALNVSANSLALINNEIQMNYKQAALILSKLQNKSLLEKFIKENLSLALVLKLLPQGLEKWLLKTSHNNLKTAIEKFEKKCKRK